MLTNTEIIRALHYGMTVQCYTLRGYSKTLMTLGLGKGLTSHTVWHRAAVVRFLVPPESDGMEPVIWSAKSNKKLKSTSTINWWIDDNKAIISYKMNVGQTFGERQLLICLVKWSARVVEYLQRSHLCFFSALAWEPSLCLFRASSRVHDFGHWSHWCLMFCPWSWLLTCIYTI